MTIPEADAKSILKRLHDTHKYEEVSALLSQFRILTREKTLTDDVLDDECMDLLVGYSKDYHTEAQKCISNLILNYAHVREKLIEPYIDCVDLRLKGSLYRSGNSCGDQDQKSLPGIAGDKLKRCEVLYYDLRIVFLLSALCPSSRGNIRDRLLDSILRVTQHEIEEFGADNYLLVIECLKTLFNLTLDKCINTNLASSVIKNLFSIVDTERDINPELELGAESDPTDKLLVNLIHLLTNMPEQVYSDLSDDDVDKIFKHLDELLKSHTKGTLRDTVLPVLNVCANICKHKEDVRRRWFEEIIGSSKNFEKRPEEYDTLRGRLVKLMTSVDVHVKEIAAEFLYALCRGDTEKFITYTGFGNSAAYLATKGLLSRNSGQSFVGRNQDDEERISEITQSDADRQYRELREKLDPITGKLEEPKCNPMEGMSEEEKEWHAHELASTITKLSKLGVMKPIGVDASGELSELDPRATLPVQSTEKDESCRPP